MKSLHLIQDTPFMNDFFEAVSLADKLEDHDILIYYSPSGNLSDPKVLNDKIKSRIKYRGLEVSDYSKQKLEQYDKVFIHCLTKEMHGFLQLLSPHTKVFWLFFGSDYYMPDWKFKDYLFEKDTKKIVEDKNFAIDNTDFEYEKKFLTRSRNPIKWPAHYTRLKRLQDKIHRDAYNYKAQELVTRQEMISRINYIAGVSELDFEFIKNNYSVNASYLPSFYTFFDNAHFNSKAYDNTFLRSNFNFGDEKVILFGNCGTYSNNHIDLLPLLSKKIRGKKIKLVVPLSYGDKNCISRVSKAFSQELGSQFFNFDRYLTKPEYYHFLHSIDIAVMNHKINEAGTNLFMLLYYGKKVFVREENVFAKYLSERGVKLFSHQDLKRLPIEESLAPFSPQEAERNKNQMMEIFSLKKSKENIRRMLDA